MNQFLPMQAFRSTVRVCSVLTRYAPGHTYEIIEVDVLSSDLESMAGRTYRTLGRVNDPSLKEGEVYELTAPSGCDRVFSHLRERMNESSPDCQIVVTSTVDVAAVRRRLLDAIEEPGFGRIASQGVSAIDALLQVIEGLVRVDEYVASDNEGFCYCPWCHASLGEDHADGCVFVAAQAITTLSM